MHFPTRAFSIAVILGLATATQADQPRDSFRTLALSLDDGSLTASMKTPSKTPALRTGEKVTFHVDGVADSALFVLNMDSKGTLFIIYPNKFDKNPKQAKNSVQIPADGAGYVFKASGDPGTETVKFIAIKGARAKFESILQDMFDTQQAFPRALVPTATATQTLDSYLAAPGDVQIRTATIEYRIVN